MYFCYIVVKNYGHAIILFTLLSKAILFPLSLTVQKNSIRMVKIQSKLDEVKLRYAGDKNRIADEQIKLYDSNKYSPAIGCLPTLIQIPLILGLINVIYNPLQHLLHLGKDTITLLAGKAAEIAGTQSLGMGEHLYTIDAIHNPENLATFETLRSYIPDFDNVIMQIQQFDLNFLGFNLGMTPSITNITILTLIPIISGLTCLLMCLIQNKINVLQREQGAVSQWGMTLFLVVFSTYFPFIVPAGVGLYWIFSNLFSIVVMFLVNIIIDPKKYIDYAARPQKVVLSREERMVQKQKQKENRLREKSDNNRFYSSDNERKQLVFYSVKSGFYKYFENIIGHILEHTEIVIHYVTSDPDDAIFKKDNPQIIPYYIGEKALIPFMMKMDADMVVMTMPDLQKYHIKRSLVRKDIEYLYMFHTVASMHMTLREGAVDHYDTVFCVGPHQVAEIRRTEELYELPQKKLIECGYGLIDNLTAAYECMPKRKEDKKQILVAPSWHEGNIMESCLDKLLEQLLGQGNRVIVRPHPEFGKRFLLQQKAIVDRYKPQFCDDFIIEIDFSSNQTIYQSDLLITDWSNIAFEFSYSSKKPSLFINTPMKVMNPEYEVLEITPLDVTLRDEIGCSVDLDKLSNVADIVEEMLESPDEYRGRITDVVNRYLFNPGRSGEVGGGYIIEALEQKKLSREQEEQV